MDKKILTQEERQISFAWKSGLLIFLSLALFIGFGIGGLYG